MQLLQKNRCFEGEQRIYQFDSQLLKGSTKFGVYLPPAALEGKPCSTLFYLAGLTCTEETSLYLYSRPILTVSGISKAKAFDTPSNDIINAGTTAFLSKFKIITPYIQKYTMIIPQNVVLCRNI